MAANHAGGCHGPYVSHVGQAHLRPLGCFHINQQVADAGEVGANLWNTPNHHIKYLLILEQGSHGDAGHH